MRVLDVIGAFRALCRTTRKHGIYLTLHEKHSTDVDIAGATGLRKNSRIVKALSEQGEAIALFGNWRKMMDVYRKINCDGPSEANPYAGPAHVFAVTCSSRGRLESENT